MAIHFDCFSVPLSPTATTQTYFHSGSCMQKASDPDYHQNSCIFAQLFSYCSCFSIAGTSEHLRLFDRPFCSTIPYVPRACLPPPRPRHGTPVEVFCPPELEITSTNNLARAETHPRRIDAWFRNLRRSEYHAGCPFSVSCFILHISSTV